MYLITACAVDSCSHPQGYTQQQSLCTTRQEYVLYHVPTHKATNATIQTLALAHPATNGIVS